MSGCVYNKRTRGNCALAANYTTKKSYTRECHNVVDTSKIAYCTIVMRLIAVKFEWHSKPLSKLEHSATNLAARSRQTSDSRPNNQNPYARMINAFLPNSTTTKKKNGAPAFTLKRRHTIVTYNIAPRDCVCSHIFGDCTFVVCVCVLIQCFCFVLLAHVTGWGGGGRRRKYDGRWLQTGDYPVKICIPFECNKSCTQTPKMCASARKRQHARHTT